MIQENPAIIESIDKTVLNVNELHVTDYYNLDFRSSDQTREFMPALESKDFAFAQKAQPNGVE